MVAKGYMRKLEIPRTDGTTASVNIDIEFPDGKGFRSVNIPVPLDEIIRLSEERLPLINSSPDAEEQRLAAKCKIPFEL